MTAWTNEELTKIGNAEELKIAGRRQDGTLRKFTIIWVVRVDNDLYVRSVYGRDSGWFRGVQVRHEGQIRAGGVEKDVDFVDVDASDAINQQIDAEYRRKYSRYAASIIDSTVTAKARSATIKLVPR